MAKRTPLAFVLFNIIALLIIPFLLGTTLALLNQYKVSTVPNVNTPYLIVSCIALMIFNMNYSLPLLIVGYNNIDSLLMGYCPIQWIVGVWTSGIFSFTGLRLAWELRNIVARTSLNSKNRRNFSDKKWGEYIWWTIIIIVPIIFAFGGHFYAITHNKYLIGLYTCGAVNPEASFVKSMDLILAIATITFTLHALWGLKKATTPSSLGNSSYLDKRKASEAGISIHSTSSSTPITSSSDRYSTAYVSQSSSIRFRLACYVALYLAVLGSIGVTHIISLVSAAKGNLVSSVSHSGIYDFSSILMAYFVVAIFGTTDACVKWYKHTLTCGKMT